METNQDDTRQILTTIGRGAASTMTLLRRLWTKIYRNTLGALVYRFRVASASGKVMVLIGLAGCVGTAYLAFRDSLEFEIKEHDYLVVSSARANVRTNDSTKSKVIRRLRRGDRAFAKTESERWWYVEGEDWGRPGWIAKSVVERVNKTTLNIQYEFKGYLIGFLVAFIVMYIGFCRRKTQAGLL